MLKIYNTLTRSKEIFKPRVEGKVGLYVCGITVYDYCHIGHARMLVVFDMVARYFRYSTYDLVYVRNITDIDDKIIQRANVKGEEFLVLTERFIDAMHEDEQALSILPPDIEPKATQSMDEIVAMIEALIEKELAYIGTNGDVFYSVAKFDGYGNLSGKNIEDLQVGERVDIDIAKKDPLDFVLWKMAKANEPYWDSPWGRGRPGWHIECSAMSTHCLGNNFDIHGGGMDLQFPHHENEIAQSEGATGEKFVNLWMHNGFVRVDEEKMSKSLDNFFTIREVLKKYRGEIIRFFILSSHYRSPLNYSEEQLVEAGSALTRLYTALRGVEIKAVACNTEYKNRFNEAMDDDFNTPVAIAVLFDLARDLNKSKENETKAAVLASTLKNLAGVLGILQEDPGGYLKGSAIYAAKNTVKVTQSATTKVLTEEAIEIQIKERLNAKLQKKWDRADKIRDQLKEQGIILEDIPGGKTTWRRK